MTVLDEIRDAGLVVRLGNIVDRVQVVGYPEAEPLSVYLGRGVVRRADQDDNHNVLGSDLAKYQHVLPGDLVFNRLRTWQGGFGASRHEGIVSPAYIVLRPRDVDARYLDFVLHSSPYLAELTRLSKWMPPSQFDILWNDLRTVLVPYPPLEEQRRIADFLDDRVARIDRIIAARRQQIDLVAASVDAEWGALSEALERQHGLVALRRFLASIADGPFGSSLTSNHYTDVGTRVIRLGNIGVGDFRGADAAFISDEYAHELSSHEAVSGDLVMAGLGDERWPLGRCAVVPDDLGRAIVKADCYRIRLDRRVDHDFAAQFLSSPPARGRTALHARGATRARLNTDVARVFEIPPASLDEQALYVAEVRRLKGRSGVAKSALTRSIDLLTEYKTSLITAAVTGELDVTTAGSGIPDTP